MGVIRHVQLPEIWSCSIAINAGFMLVFFYKNLVEVKANKRKERILTVLAVVIANGKAFKHLLVFI